MIARAAAIEPGHFCPVMRRLRISCVGLTCCASLVLASLQPCPVDPALIAAVAEAPDREDVATDPGQHQMAQSKADHRKTDPGKVDHAAMGHGEMNHAQMDHGNEAGTRAEPDPEAESSSMLVMKAPCICGCGDAVLFEITGPSALQKGLLGGVFTYAPSEDLPPEASSLPLGPALVQPRDIDHVPIA